MMLWSGVRRFLQTLAAIALVLVGLALASGLVLGIGYALAWIFGAHPITPFTALGAFTAGLLVSPVVLFLAWVLLWLVRGARNFLFGDY